MRPVFLENLNPFWAFRSTFSSFFRIFARLTRKDRSRRFLLLSPPCCRKQFIYDRKQKNFFSVLIRDRVDLGTLRQIFQDEDYGFSKLRRHEELDSKYVCLRNQGLSPIILDCGANIGLAALYFSREYPDAIIICVEPDGENLLLARMNNRSENVKVYQGAIGSTPGRARIINRKESNNAFRTECAPAGDIEVFSVPQLLDEVTLETKIAPFIAKVDIEGFESELFSRETSWVENFEVLIVELHDWMLPGVANSRNFLQTITGLNRDFVYIGENVFSIRNPS